METYLYLRHRVGVAVAFLNFLRGMETPPARLDDGGGGGLPKLP